MGEFAIGQSVSRFEDPRLLQGGGRYVGDMVLPGMVFGYVLRSPHAHARIRSIDTSKAKAAPGVLTVLTGEDWQASGWGDLPVPDGLKRRDGSVFRPPYPALIRDRVRWVGDYVAFVVAETYHQALDAAELIVADYEPLPAIVSTAEASAEGAPRVWEDCPDNIGFVQLFGDKAATEAAFAKADHIVKQRLVINRVTAASMEPRGCLGDYNAAEDRYTIYTTLQRVHPFRAELSPVLRVPESRIRVVAGDIGGSFGMKSAVYNEVALVLLASKRVRRPVKWMSTRSESFLCDAQARDNVTDAELALDRDGNFLAVRVKTIANLGAYLQVGGQTFISNIGTLAGVYRTPALHADITAVFTHTNPVRPYRGNGRPEAAYVIERLVDLAADQLGLDPVELRRRNTIPPEAMPFRTGLTFTYDSGEFAQNMDMALKLADFAGFEARRAQSQQDGKLRGIGISNTIEKAAAPSYEGAEIRFDRSGAVTLLSGTINQGQGHETAFKQIVCDRLGLDPREVVYLQGDTDQVSFGEGTGGSRSGTIGGSAFLLATDKILGKATALAAHILKVPPDDTKFADGIFSSPKTNQTVTINEVAKAAAVPTKLPKGMEPGLVATAVFDLKMENYPNGCHVCELEIDPDTGRIEIMRYSVVDDVGTVINPLLVHGQIVGGVAQGVGQILMEDIAFDADSGQLISGSFMDYAMPRATDLSSV
ncbi:MAG: xanthine dehydrogenase family protein molybdopterin-binding subunit, partial [Xanthobacteraceae bacterium]